MTCPLPVWLRLHEHPASVGDPWTEPPLLLRRALHTEVLAMTSDLDAAARWAIARSAVPLSPPLLRRRVAELAVQTWLACVDPPDLPSSRNG